MFIILRMGFKSKIFLTLVIFFILGFWLFSSENISKELIPEWYVESSIEQDSINQLLPENSQYSFTAVNKDGFNYFNNSKNESTECTYLKKHSNGADSFPMNFFMCETNLTYDYFFPVPNLGEENIKKFSAFGFGTFGLKFKDAKTFDQILNSNENNEIVFEYDKKYIDPLTSEGNLSFSGIVDNVYKGDLIIKNHTFELNPDKTLFATPLSQKLGPAAETLVSSKAAGASLGCLIGGAVGGGIGALIDLFSFGATLGAGTAYGAAAGCGLGGSVGYTRTPDLDKRFYCAIYRDNALQDYAVCQSWLKDTKIRSDTFNGVLSKPEVGKLVRYKDHLEISFMGDSQKVSFLF